MLAKIIEATITFLIVFQILRKLKIRTISKEFKFIDKRSKAYSLIWITLTLYDGKICKLYQSCLWWWPPR